MATVLLVDDSIPTLNRLAICFRRWGHQVNTQAVANNVVNTLAREPVDLVLLDVLMIGIDGIDVLRAIRKNPDPALAATPVVMYSMARDPRIIAQALKAGAQDYIIKATATEELRQRLSKYLAR